jgi:hypothetical protein
MSLMVRNGVCDVGGDGTLTSSSSGGIMAWSSSDLSLFAAFMLCAQANVTGRL